MTRLVGAKPDHHDDMIETVIVRILEELLQDTSVLSNDPSSSRKFGTPSAVS